MCVSVRAPSDLTKDIVKGLNDTSFGNVFLITGVEKNVGDQELSRTSLNDFASHPYVHGFFSAIDSIVHLHNHFLNYREIESTATNIEPLELVFSSTITEGFQKLGTTNPVCWMHLGHGDVEQRPVTHDEEYEEECCDDVPNISDGSEEDSFIDTADICKMIKKNEGDILFCALPLCFSKSNGDELQSTGKISLIHGIYSGKVNSMNQFSDGETEKERVKKDFHSWSEWVNAMYDASRELLIELINSGKL